MQIVPNQLFQTNLTVICNGINFGLASNTCFVIYSVRPNFGDTYYHNLIFQWKNLSFPPSRECYERNFYCRKFGVDSDPLPKTAHQLLE